MCFFYAVIKTEFPIKQERILLCRILRLRRAHERQFPFRRSAILAERFLYHRNAVSYDTKNNRKIKCPHLIFLLRHRIPVLIFSIFQDIIEMPDIINSTSNISHTIFSIVSDSDIQSFLLFHKYDKLLPVPSLKYVLFQRIPGIPGS